MTLIEKEAALFLCFLRSSVFQRFSFVFLRGLCGYGFCRSVLSAFISGKVLLFDYGDWFDD
jgi:hypothetical protein